MFLRPCKEYIMIYRGVNPYVKIFMVFVTTKGGNEVLKHIYIYKIKASFLKKLLSHLLTRHLELLSFKRTLGQR